MSQLILLSQGHKVKGQTRRSKIFYAQYPENTLFEKHQTWYATSKVKLLWTKENIAYSICLNPFYLIKIKLMPIVHRDAH